MRPARGRGSGVSDGPGIADGSLVVTGAGGSVIDANGAVEVDASPGDTVGASAEVAQPAAVSIKAATARTSPNRRVNSCTLPSAIEQTDKASGGTGDVPTRPAA
jgi:hypothetical protein